MSKPTIDEEHLRHCMLFLFDQGMKTNEVTKTITDTYGDVLKLNTCHRWLNKFKNGNRNLGDVPRTGRPHKLDDDVLTSLVESDPRQTIGELSAKLGCPRSTVQEHLHHIGKLNKQGIRVPRELSLIALESNKNDLQTVQKINTEPNENLEYEEITPRNTLLSNLKKECDDETETERNINDSTKTKCTKKINKTYNSKEFTINNYNIIDSTVKQEYCEGTVDKVDCSDLVCSVNNIATSSFMNEDPVKTENEGEVIERNCFDNELNIKREIDGNEDVEQVDKYLIDNIYNKNEIQCNTAKMGVDDNDLKMKKGKVRNKSSKKKDECDVSLKVTECNEHDIEVTEMNIKMEVNRKEKSNNEKLTVQIKNNKELTTNEENIELKTTNNFVTNKNDEHSVDESEKQTVLSEDKVPKPVLKRLFQCNLCPKTFSRMFNLRTHLNLHAGIKPYACDLCPYASTQSSNLKMHLKMIHWKKQKSHICDICSSGFALRHQLKEHRLTHSDEKPLACELCSYTTNQKKLLRGHMRSHNPIKPYICTECPKTFLVLSNLKRHQAVHSGVKDQLCGVCSFSTICKYRLRKHKARCEDINKKT